MLEVLQATHDNMGFLVADVSRLMRRSFARRLSEGTITLNEARALAYIGRNQGLRQIDLAELLEMQPIQLARLIDRLCEMKLVERQASPDDRRAYHIYLLPAAGAVLASFEKVAKTIRDEAMEGLSQEQIEALIFALTHIRNNFKCR